MTGEGRQRRPLNWRGFGLALVAYAALGGLVWLLFRNPLSLYLLGGIGVLYSVQVLFSRAWPRSRQGR